MVPECLSCHHNIWLLKRLYARKKDAAEKQLLALEKAINRVIVYTRACDRHPRFSLLDAVAPTQIDHEKIFLVPHSRV